MLSCHFRDIHEDQSLGEEGAVCSGTWEVHFFFFLFPGRGGAVRICVGHICIHSSCEMVLGYLAGTGVFFWLFLIQTILRPADVRNVELLL